MPIPSHPPTCQTLTYPTRCSRCGERVFYLQCTCGSKVFFNDLNDFERHECDGAPARRPEPPRNTRLHVTIENSKRLHTFQREITNAIREWDRAGVVIRTIPVRNHKFEIWLKNSSAPEVLDQLANLFLAGFQVESRFED